MNELIKTLDEIWRFYESDKQALICFFRSDYKYFDKKAKRKEADEMEGDLNYKRASIEQLKQFLISDSWLPTSESINALPEPVRKFIYDIETNTDPTHIVRENILIKDTCKALVLKLEEKGPMVTEKWLLHFLLEMPIYDAQARKDYALRKFKEAGIKVVKK